MENLEFSVTNGLISFTTQEGNRVMVYVPDFGECVIPYNRLTSEDLEKLGRYAKEHGVLAPEHDFRDTIYSYLEGTKLYCIGKEHRIALGKMF